MFLELYSVSIFQSNASEEDEIEKSYGMGVGSSDAQFLKDMPVSLLTQRLIGFAENLTQQEEDTKAKGATWNRAKEDKSMWNFAVRFSNDLLKAANKTQD